MNPVSITTVRVRVEKLIGYHAGLVRVLGESGLSGDQLNEVFSNHLRVQCSRCGIRVAGDEIMNVWVSDREAKLSHPKLDRLRLGYCAREGCEADYYTVSFEEYPGVNWPTISENIYAWLAATDAARQEQARRTLISSNKGGSDARLMY